MQVRAIKTERITPGSIKLFDLFDKYIKSLSDGSILAVTSKVVSLCEGRVVPARGSSKDELIKKEADLYLSKEENRYNLYLTVKDNILAVSAGIDESNAAGHFVLWPKDPQKTANDIREYLTKRFKLKQAGAIITDSKTTPLRWGVTGIPIAHSGFKALKNLIGTPDLFGRKLKVTKVAVADALAAAAALVMGEGAEQTPLSIISDVPFAEFQDRNPTKKELEELKIAIEEDVYAPILKRAPWKTAG
jgi:putative folate metabolism gamma-glutamate ligase